MFYTLRCCAAVSYLFRLSSKVDGYNTQLTVINFYIFLCNSLNMKNCDCVYWNNEFLLTIHQSANLYVFLQCLIANLKS